MIPEESEFTCLLAFLETAEWNWISWSVPVRRPVHSRYTAAGAENVDIFGVVTFMFPRFPSTMNRNAERCAMVRIDHICIAFRAFSDLIVRGDDVL